MAPPQMLPLARCLKAWTCCVGLRREVTAAAAAAAAEWNLKHLPVAATLLQVCPPTCGSCYYCDASTGFECTGFRWQQNCTTTEGEAGTCFGEPFVLFVLPPPWHVTLSVCVVCMCLTDMEGSQRAAACCAIPLRRRWLLALPHLHQASRTNRALRPWRQV